jgi:hypothetical protein
LVELPLEASAPEVFLVCETAEDEARLRLWLGRSAQLELLGEFLGRLLDELDGFGERRAA